MLDVRRIRVLREIARQGTLAGAAEALDYTQPAISHHVRRLEDEVGTVLLVRVGRGVRLTEAAETLVRRAEPVFQTLDEAEEEVAAIAGLRSGRVRVVCFPSGSATLMPRAIARLRTQHPAVRVSLVEERPPNALELLRRGECDVVVAFGYPGQEVTAGASLHVEPILTDRVRVLLPANHALGNRAEMDLAELADADWIAGCPQCRGHLLHLSEEAGFEPRITFATDDYVAVEAMVAAGLAVALMPALVLTTVHNKAVLARRIRTAPAREISVVTSGGAQHIPAVRAMTAALREVAAELVAEQGPGDPQQRDAAGLLMPAATAV